MATPSPTTVSPSTRTQPYGVAVSGGTSDGILSNSIYSNAGPGIKLENGGNSGIQPPINLAAQSGGGETQITGTLNAAPEHGLPDPVLLEHDGQRRTGSATARTICRADLDVTTNKLGVVNFTTLLNSPCRWASSSARRRPRALNVLDDTSQFSVVAPVIQAQCDRPRGDDQAPLDRAAARPAVYLRPDGHQQRPGPGELASS